MRRVLGGLFQLELDGGGKSQNLLFRHLLLEGHQEAGFVAHQRAVAGVLQLLGEIRHLCIPPVEVAYHTPL